MSATVFRYAVHTPDGTVAQGECDFMVVPTTGGEMGILADHAPTVTSVAPGELRLVHGGRDIRVRVGSGVIEVLDNVVGLFVREASASPEDD